MLHREPVVLAGVVLVAILLWLVTTFVTRAYAVRQQQLAQRWFQRGEAGMRAGRFDQAVSELRTALAYSPDNFQYRLRLAQVLAAEGHTRQAQAYLRALWEQEPGNGTVNLDLARLAARDNNVADALRFYHGAIYGLWQDDPALHRRQTRLELIEFLLTHNARQQAQSELIGLAADLPPDPPLLLRVAALMTRAGDFRSSLQQYDQVLHLEPDSSAALAGAGKAAFSLQIYPQAREYLRRAIAGHSPDPDLQSLLQTAELILQMDPYQPHLSVVERERRIMSAFAQAGRRLQQCASARGVALAQPQGGDPLASDFALWTSLKPAVTERSLRRDPQPGDNAMDLVFRVERDSAQLCGSGDPSDQALLLIAQRREGSMP